MLIDKGYITYWENDVENLTIGVITKERDMTTMQVFYQVIVDSVRYKELERFGLDPSMDDLIVWVFLDDHFRAKWNKVPYFITMRTADRRRPDIDMILKKRGLTTYNQFQLLLATEGRYPTDHWRVLKEPVNSIQIDMPK